MVPPDAKRTEFLRGLAQAVSANIGRAYATRNLQPLTMAVDAAHAHASKLESDLFDRAAAAGQGQPACGAGCDHCCTIRVACAPVEALRVATYIREKFTRGQIIDLRHRLDAYNAESSAAPDSAAYFETRRKCPFLASGLCSVHPARPVTCRAFHSYDLDACLRFFNHREPADIPQVASVIEITAPVYQGFGQGVPAAPPVVDMQLAVARALEDGVPERFLKGERVFDDCVAPFARSAVTGA